MFEVGEGMFGVWFVEVGVGEFQFFGIIDDDAAFGGLIFLATADLRRCHILGAPSFGLRLGKVKRAQPTVSGPSIGPYPASSIPA